ncbi:hypothetical protein [Acidovorax sp. SDU_ACID1]|uniref:hypothetical protein n=1 Tax=Acidovorax sp. SDU_ACID1 TaxID=3136632 RepID=UPI00387323A8
MNGIIKAAMTGTLVIWLSGCAQSSGVLQLGPDTYTVSVHAAPARGGEAGARKQALTEAAQQCQAMGRNILVDNLSSGPSTHLPGGTANVAFKCLATGDRDLHRPTYEPKPDTVIRFR